MKNIKMSKADALKVIDALEAAYPDAKCELEYGSPFQLLMATMLSAQSTDKTVNRVTAKLFAKYPDVESLLALTQSQLEEEIREIGLYRNKAKNIIAMCRELVGRFAGQVPGSFEDLVSLPGVGRKTANVVLSNAFGVPAFAVDTHVFRVTNRIGLAHSDRVDITEKQATSLIPRERWTISHHLLIWHGRRICHAKNPRCEICCIMPYCGFIGKNIK
jgi:endonuclease-3